MQKFFKKNVAHLKKTIQKIKEKWRIKYRIVNLDLENKEVILKMKRRSLVLKYAFHEDMDDNVIIEFLSKEDAALLGHFYGQCYRLSQANANHAKIRYFSLLLKKTNNFYEILSHHRNGYVSYIDCRNQQEYLEHPLDIFNNSYVINNFDVTQAYYIGILAGLNYKKGENKETRPHLRVVN